MPLTQQQPLKALLQACAIGYLFFVLMPWWIIRYSVPSMRPKSAFSLKRVMVIEYYRYLFTNFATIFLQDPSHMQILKGKVGELGVYVDGVPDLITGDVKKWADEAGVKPATIPGYWYHKPGEIIPIGAKAHKGEKIVYHFHGGAFIALSARPDEAPANIPRGILKHCPLIKRAFSLEYRSSSWYPIQKANPFPAALLDAIAGYNYLINVLGFLPENVILAGDSAGGNLAIALTRYIIEVKLTSLPVPAAILLLSPYVALDDLHKLSSPDSSLIQYKDVDFLPIFTSYEWQYSLRAYLGQRDPSVLSHNIYISPASLHVASGNFQGFPPTFVVAGDSEVLLDQIRTLVERMRGDMDDKDVDHKLPERVVFYQSKDSVHDYLALGTLHEPEYTNTLRVINDWILSVL